MICWETKFYLLEKKKSVVLFICDNCGDKKYISAQSAKNKKYPYCHDCYQKSPERTATAKKIAKVRVDFSGENNPHYRGGKIKLTCPCGDDFDVYPARKDTAKYCSRKCKKKYSVSISKHEEYKGIKFRSSWEVSLAQYFDSLNYDWKYEPEAFETSVGFYTPDFWVEELQCYFEVKGFFRDENSKTKFKEFSETHKTVLADLKYLKSLGFSRIKSGPKKGQLCL
jgi:hypothetical protein